MASGVASLCLLLRRFLCLTCLLLEKIGLRMGEHGREEEERSAGKRRSVGGGVEWMGAWTGAWTGAATRERHYLLRGFTTPFEAARGQLHAALVCGAIMRDITRSRGCSLSPDRFR
jgi:hypothetical protein